MSTIANSPPPTRSRQSQILQHATYMNESGGIEPHIRALTLSKGTINAKWAVAKGDLVELQKNIIYYDGGKDSLIRLALETSHLNVLKWLHQVFKISVETVRSRNNLALRNAMGCGRLDTVKWLIKEFGLGRDDVYAFDGDGLSQALAGGHTQIVEWVKSVYPDTLAYVKVVPATDCSICLTSLSNESQVVLTGCGHQYHEICINRWLSTSSTCPTCRVNTN